MLSQSLACLQLALMSFTPMPQEHQGVLYTKPTGWEEAKQESAKVFTPKGLKEGEVLAIILLPALPANDEPLNDQFKKLVAAANQDAKVVESAEPVARDGEPVSLRLQAFQLETQDLGKHNRIYALIHSGKQNAFVTVVANNDAVLTKHVDAVMEFIGSIKLKAGTESKPGAGPTKSAGMIPTGAADDLFPGMPGWLPSGKGDPIPAASTAGGKPVGLWWKVQVDTRGLLKPIVHVYMPNGARASQPRLGGPRLFDQNGQARQRGTTGVGTFSVASGQLTENYNGFVNKGAYKAGSDSDGAYFKIGEALFRPVVPLTMKTIVGSWKALSTQYDFKADGTYKSGTVVTTGEYSAGSFTSGTYVIDGFLLMLVPSNGPMTIDVAGLGGLMMIKGSTFFVKS